MIDIETQRGVTQLVAGICWAVFGLGMYGRAWRRYRLGWPVAWGILAGSAMLSVAYSLAAHGLYWLGIGGDLRGWPLVAPLYVMAVTSVWTLCRWLRIGEPHELTTLPDRRRDDDA